MQYGAVFNQDFSLFGGWARMCFVVLRDGTSVRKVKYQTFRISCGSQAYVGTYFIWETFLLNVPLSYPGELQCFFSWWVRGIFFDDFYAHVAIFKSTSLHWVSDEGFKTQNNFSSMKLRYWTRLQRFILINPLPFVLNISLTHFFFFVSCKDILAKKSHLSALIEDFSCYW